MTNSADNRTLVERFHRAMREKMLNTDTDLAEFFTPSVRWHLPRSSPLHGTLNDKAAVLALFEGAVDDYYQTNTIRFDYQGCLADEQLVILQFVMSATTAAGDAYENDYCMVFRVEDGLISEVWEYFDTNELFSKMPQS